ncbi:hypothetical protein C8R43DRAFT_1105243 [Mycena crocata]|nr:hypothetical protein C8R43DRAFT_1105243 [Mycena crocata]
MCQRPQKQKRLGQFIFPYFTPTMATPPTLQVPPGLAKSIHDALHVLHGAKIETTSLANRIHSLESTFMSEGATRMQMQTSMDELRTQLIESRATQQNSETARRIAEAAHKAADDAKRRAESDKKAAELAKQASEKSLGAMQASLGQQNDDLAERQTRLAEREAALRMDEECFSKNQNALHEIARKVLRENKRSRQDDENETGSPQKRNKGVTRPAEESSASPPLGDDEDLFGATPNPETAVSISASGSGLNNYLTRCPQCFHGEFTSEHIRTHRCSFSTDYQVGARTIQCRLYRWTDLLFHCQAACGATFRSEAEIERHIREHPEMHDEHWKSPPHGKRLVKKSEY